WCSYPKAHTLTTAYALIGLAEAKSLGYPVRDTVLSRALRLVRSRLAAPSLFLARWQLNRQAFLLYALAVSGSPDKARNTELYMQRARLNLDAVAFLAMALHSVNPDDERLETLAQMMLNRAVTRATGVFFEETYQDRWNWSSDVRSTALALNATLKIRPESELLPNIVRHLVTVRKGRGYWTSRQENVWSIIALTNWMRASGELDPDYSWSVSLNESAVSTGDASSENVLEADELRIDVADMIQRETNLIEFERDAGAGAFYYSAHLNLSLPIDDIAPFGRGLEISRSYTLLDDEKKTPIARAAIGETVQVRLRIVAPNTLRYVVIEDFFPAGAEAINPNLATSPQLGTIPRGDRIDARRQGWGWWYFDHVEFHDEKAVIYANYLPRGVYEFVYTLRPTIAGEFKVIPPVAQEMYFPEVYGRGAGALFAITEET
ncbi:MAG: alpha-2-macroglobulin, partial [Chloroflexi bacterium]|nr:alpha-2-macroglobulin [Chloroflexota bacterium]